MRKGTIVEHKNKEVGSNGYSHDGLYYFNGECRMKLPCGEWIDAVQYEDIKTKAIYVRSKEDFFNRFKEYES